MARPVVQQAPGWVHEDEMSWALAISMHQDDAQELASASRGKQREGELSDAELALTLYTEELTAATTSAADRQMARRIQNTTHNDPAALQEHQEEERMAESSLEVVHEYIDHINAPREDRGATNAGLGTETTTTDTSRSKGENPVAGHPRDFTTNDQPESSSWAASRPLEEAPHSRDCLACGDVKDHTELLRAPCQHDYCHGCLVQFFQAATFDEGLFPPRCCRQPIPLDLVHPLLSDDTSKQFQLKEVEFSTLERTYCHQPRCAAFIAPAHYEDGIARCPICAAATCIHCKGANHTGSEDCPKDEALHQVLQLARKENWQRCTRCRTMIELGQGCYHITCKCGNEFCYLCATPWKRCECRQWDEDRLHDRAEEVFLRDDWDAGALRCLEAIQHRLEALRQEAAPAERLLRDDWAARINMIATNLRRNHDARDDHNHQWQRREDRMTCEVCEDESHFNFINECTECHIMACLRCELNRLVSTGG
ncbi:hypothetical protein GGR56DRAFT_667713 [Xylariaceae sp. FL0804]|nr:hypothetical protein GGR56DRAFT_667713 [Xylariaceae sp. FL0804]